MPEPTRGAGDPPAVEAIEHAHRRAFQAALGTVLLVGLSLVGLGAYLYFPAKAAAAPIVLEQLTNSELTVQSDTPAGRLAEPNMQSTKEKQQ